MRFATFDGSAWQVTHVGAFGDDPALAFDQAGLPAVAFHDWLVDSLAVTLGMLGTVLLLPAVRNTRRWIRAGGFAFEPSELAIVVFLAYMLEKKREHEEREVLHQGQASSALGLPELTRRSSHIRFLSAAKISSNSPRANVHVPPPGGEKTSICMASNPPS